jgi:hypothetical protein
LKKAVPENGLQALQGSIRPLVGLQGRDDRDLAPGKRPETDQGACEEQRDAKGTQKRNVASA